MGLFDFLKGPDIQQGVREYGETPGAVLLDVRTPQEFREGHIPGSRNVPLQSLSAGGRGPRREGRAAVCLLPQRRAEQSGGGTAGPDGLCPREKYRRNGRLSRKDGTLT